MIVRLFLDIYTKDSVTLQRHLQSQIYFLSIYNSHNNLVTRYYLGDQDSETRWPRDRSNPNNNDLQTKKSSEKLILMTLFYTYRSRPCSSREASPAADGNKYRDQHTGNAPRVGDLGILSPNRDFAIKYHPSQLREPRGEGVRKNISQRGQRTPRK